MSGNYRSIPLLTVALMLMGATSVPGVIFLSTDDVAHNREVAPGGSLAGSGWQYQGEFGSFLGTMVSPQHFLTAAHISSSPTTFVSSGYFNGGADVTYTVNTTVNGGTGYWNIAGTDLRVFQINETFASYAPLYESTNEVGKELVVMGRGTQRGTTVSLEGDDLGWRWGAADSAARWGTNQVAGTAGDADEYLYSTFDVGVVGDEAHLSSGDSGGAVFIQEGGVWKLAGINYAVDGSWDYNDVPDTDEFDAALYDSRGMYNGSDSGGWTLVPDGPVAVPSGFYATRVSSYVDEIEAITTVPEPRVWGLLPIAGLFAGFRRRRK